ncbi:MAG: ABC transporter permease subunit [Methylococcales bacterium]|nr:ABC transporter permease subunit [Methylococcales bacterium]
MLRMILAKECQALLQSPSAWAMLALLQVLLAAVFLMQIDAFMQLKPQLAALAQPPGITEIIIRPLYSNAAVLLLLLTPLLTMRGIAEEKRQHSLTLLLAAPVSSHVIILAKFLALWGWSGISVVLTSLMSFSLLLAGRLDVGLWLANVLGLGLLSAAFCALGLAMSSRFRHPVSAALTSFAVLLPLWLLDGFNQSRPRPDPVLDYLAMPGHWQRLQSGLLDSGDISYFLLFTLLCLGAAIRSFEWQRLNP